MAQSNETRPKCFGPAALHTRVQHAVGLVQRKTTTGWDGAAKETRLRVNQNLAPVDWEDIGDNNTLWERLIVFKAESTLASITL